MKARRDEDITWEAWVRMLVDRASLNAMPLFCVHLRGRDTSRQMYQALLEQAADQLMREKLAHGHPRKTSNSMAYGT